MLSLWLMARRAWSVAQGGKGRLSARMLSREYLNSLFPICFALHRSKPHTSCSATTAASREIDHRRRRTRGGRGNGGQPLGARFRDRGGRITQVAVAAHRLDGLRAAAAAAAADGPRSSSCRSPARNGALGVAAVRPRWRRVRHSFVLQLFANARVGPAHVAPRHEHVFCVGGGDGKKGNEKKGGGGLRRFLFCCFFSFCSLLCRQRSCMVVSVPAVVVAVVAV